jgi:hypothetical protein
MKPFLGIDITTNRKNERLNGNEFLILKPSEILSQTLAKTTEQKDVIIQKSKMPLLLRIIKSICLFLAFICVSALLRARVSLAEAYHNAPWVFWLLPICVILFVLLTICEKVKSHQVLDTDENQHALATHDRVMKDILAELAVPDNAKNVDVLSCYYTERNGKIKAIEKGLQVHQFSNLIFKAYRDNENLYLTNCNGKYAFPLSSLSSIRTVKKHTVIKEWHKESLMIREYINRIICQLTSLAVSIVIPIIFLRLYIIQKPMESIFLVMNYRFSKSLPDYVQNK